MEMKYLDEIVNSNPQHQFVLYFEDLSPVTVAPDDLKPDATFFRRSRKRLGETFFTVDSGAVSSVYDPASVGHVTVWKTDRGRLSDYVLYESESHEYISTWVNTRAKSKAHSYYRQMTVNSLTPHDNKHELSVYLSNTQEGIVITFKCDAFGEHTTKPLVNLYPDMSWFLVATVYSLHLVRSSKDQVSRCILYYPDKRQRDTVYMLSTHKWKPYRSNLKFVRTMDRLKEEMPGMDILFKA